MKNVPNSQQLTIEQALSRAKKATKQGKTAVAVQLYNAVLQHQPNHPVAKKGLRKLQAGLPHNQAAQIETADPSQDQINALVELYHSGQLIKTEQACRELLQTYPQSLVVFNVLGVVLCGRGKLQEAVTSYDKAIRIKPDFAEAYTNRGNALKELGQLGEALRNYDKAIQINPDYAEAFSNRGATLKDLGQLEGAVASYDKAIQINPDYAEAYNNRGIALEQLGQLDEALQSYNKVIQLKPNSADAYTNRGSTLSKLGRLDGALRSHDQAIQFRPDCAEAFNNRGNTLKELGRLNEGMKNFSKAIQLKPDYAGAYSNFLLALNYTSNHSAFNRIAMARKFGEIVKKKAQSHSSPYQSPPMPGRLRVAFVSGDLRNHPIGYFLESILSSIDPSRIDVIAYPTTHTIDALSERIKPFFSKWKSIYAQKDEAAANLINADGVHVLIDLSGHTADNRLPVFAYKPAPVQVSWLGYFATTGLNEMDYLLGDPYVTPPKYDNQFIEKVWRLPETRWCFTPPNVDIELSVLPALSHGYVTFGCFNNLIKVNDKVVELWAKMLDAIPNSRLLLKAKQFRDLVTRESVIQRFIAQGINSNRIMLEGPEDRQKYFAAYNRIDITLDPFPFTGGTTSIESLWMGVPLVTLAGGSLVSRQGVGVLMNAGLPDWIAADEEEYLAKAILFASDLDKLARLRTGLRSQVLASPLFDAPRFARNFENAFLEMWNQYTHRS